MKMYLTTAEVVETVGLSRTVVWELERRGDFPSRRQISSKRVGFLASEVLEWAESRPVAKPSEQMAERAQHGGSRLESPQGDAT
jgi:predicted DNA-binding transcriptional regulator AlpA